jgi:formate dehydrogenase subunit gamma
LRTDAIPLEPVPLTAAEARAMLQNQIKKHHVAVILLHWFNGYVWFFELLTGLALLSSPLFRVVPQWYISIVEGIFGSRANMLTAHIAVGLTWIVVLLVYGLFGFHTYLRGEILRKEVFTLERDDIRWLIIRVTTLLHLTHEPLPPQGHYNAGQKVFALSVYLMVPVVMVTGLVMTFRLFGPEAVGWAVVLHFGAVGGVVAGLVIHLYMGSVFPEEKPAFFSMITGNVNELHVYRHHFKWWREVKLAEQEWAKTREGGAAEEEPPPAKAADGEFPAESKAPNS